MACSVASICFSVSDIAFSALFALSFVFVPVSSAPLPMLPIALMTASKSEKSKPLSNSFISSSLCLFCSSAAFSSSFNLPIFPLFIVPPLASKNDLISTLNILFLNLKNSPYFLVNTPSIFFSTSSFACEIVL